MTRRKPEDWGEWGRFLVDKSKQPEQSLEVQLAEVKAEIGKLEAVLVSQESVKTNKLTGEDVRQLKGRLAGLRIKAAEILKKLMPSSEM